ncbi:MAG: glycosyltransferase family 39 protein [Firmicutes bacterium]|nr:glycosyltransferase family 39 protein [Bacillota bacterium]
MIKKSLITYFLYISIFVSSLIVILLSIVKRNGSFMNITPDGQLYYNLAQNLVAGQGLINTIRVEEIIVPPLFAIILAPFAWLFENELPFFIFQYVLYGINAVGTAYIVYYLFKNRLAAWVSGLAYAVQPVLYTNGPQYLLTETIFISFILVTIWLLVRWIEEKGNIRLGGLLITVVGLSILFRPHLLFLLGIIFLLILFFSWKFKQTIWTLFFLLIPVGLLILNGAYNQSVQGEFVTLENYSGQNLYIANNPETDVRFYATPMLEEFVEPYYFTLKDDTLSVRSEKLKNRAITYIVAEPVETIERMIKKMILFFKPLGLIDGVTIFVSVLGLVLAFIFDRKRWLIHTVIFLFILGFVALTTLGLLVGGQRYRAPLIPVYLIYIGYFVSLIYFKMPGTRKIQEKLN